MSKRTQRHRQPAPTQQRSWLSFAPLVLGGGLILGVLLVAVLATQTSQPPPESTSIGRTGSPFDSGSSVAITGAALPRFVSTLDDPAVDQSAPEVDGLSFDGTPVVIEANDRPKLILFIAHWCPHCQREVPLVQGWLDRDGMPRGVEFVSVATSNDPSRPNYPPDAWLERERWSVPVMVDPDGRIADAYGLNAFPYWVLVDRDGRVVGRLTGELPIPDIEAIMARLAVS